MNLLLLGWSPSSGIDSDRAEAMFARVRSEVPLADDGPSKTWLAPSGRLLALCAGHRPQQTGGVAYWHFEADRFAMYSGRPILWTGDFEADGRLPLDPRFYLQPPEAWRDALDGRCVVARYEDAPSTLDLYTDPLGAYHLYTTTHRGTHWFSNNAELLRRIADRRTVDPLVIASLVACGWSLGGQPVWQDVRRLPRGKLLRFEPDRETHHQLLSISEIGECFAPNFDARAAAGALVTVVRALVDWPGRPSSVSLTGGRDSRLVFAAALQAGVEFEPRIIAGKHDRETPDVRTARILCETEDRSLTVAHSRDVATLEDAARALQLCAPGTLTIDLARNALDRPAGSGLAEGAFSEPLAIVHSGHGGELARTFYGVGDGCAASVATSLYRQITHLWPRPPISKAGGQLIKDYLSEWVNDGLAQGVAAPDLPDLFYLLERMNNWVGGSHGFDEYLTDVTSPLWTPRLLPHEFGLPAGERSRELFHFHVLNELRPELTRVPFAESNPSWPTFGQTRAVRAERMRRLAGRAARGVRRRYDYRLGRTTGGNPPRGLAEAAALARGQLPESSHEVWQVLDPKRARALLARDPIGLDARSQRTMWRLATVFLACVD